METKKLISFGILSTSALLLGTTFVQAAPATTVPVDSKAKVQLKDTWENGGIIDPGTKGPDKTNPDEPVPPAGDRDLSLVYYPTFDFGYHDYDSAKSVVYQAKAYTGTLVPGEGSENEVGAHVRPQFVQVRNSSAVSKWTLQVKTTDFKPNDPKGAAPLAGAQITLKNIQAINNTDNGGSATATTESELKLSEESQTIGSYNQTGQTGISRNSFLFGEVKKVKDYGLNEEGTGLEDQDVSTGVELFLPANLDITKDGNYTATMTWSFADIE